MASSSCGPARPAGVSRALPAPSLAVWQGHGVGRHFCSTMRARRQHGLAPAAPPGTSPDVLVATCAWRAPKRACLEGKVFMSEPVLGEAGNASSEPATFGRDGEEKPAMDDRRRNWSPVGPEKLT